MMKVQFFNKPGSSLMEVIISLAIILFLASGFGVLAFRSVETTLRSQDSEIAKDIAQQTLEALIAVSYDNWPSLVAGTYGLDNAGGPWVLDASPDTINNRFTRTITLSTVQRDESCDVLAVGEIVEDGTDDPDTMLAEVRIDWTSNGIARQQQFSTYLTNWKSASSCSNTPAEVIAVLDCGGFLESEIPQVILDRLIVAYEAGLLSCESERVSGNYAIGAGEAVIFAEGVRVSGNINASNDGTTLLFGGGEDAKISGNVNGAEVVGLGDDTDFNGSYNNIQNTYFLGDASMGGNFSVGNLTLLNIEPNSVVSMSGNVDYTGDGVIQSGATLVIGGTFNYNGSLLLESTSTMSVSGNMSCSGSSTATIHGTATLIVDGSQGCGAI